MVYQTAPFSMTLTPNPRVRVRVGKVRKPYINFQMVPLSMILSDLKPTFQGHDNIQRPITRKRYKIDVMYNVLSGLAACGRLGVAARPACLFGTRPVARDQRHASHVGATPAD